MGGKLVFITVAGLVGAVVMPLATDSGPEAVKPLFEVTDVYPQPCVTQGPGRRL